MNLLQRLLLNILVLIGFAGVLAACNDAPEAPHDTLVYKTEAKAEILDQFYRAWDTGDIAAFETILSKELIDHERENPRETSDFVNMGIAARKVNEGFSNIKHNPLQIHYLEDDRVIVYWNFSGQHTGTMAGFSSTNKRVEFKGVDIFQISDGMISEIWHVEALHKMMAAIRN